jgi:3-phosphoshikimate 1-carboxyvinyltransferase
MMTMHYLLQSPQHINGIISLPTSKSVCNRALIINALCNDSSPIKNISASDDSRVLEAGLNTSSTTIDIGAAGTAMRFLTAYLAQRDGEVVLTGSERMKNRPIGILVDALRKLGADIIYAEKEGFPPLQMKGKQLTGGNLELSSNISSQFISAILMIAPTLKGGLHLTLKGEIISRPYIQMTLDLMAYFGVESKWEENDIFIAEQPYIARPFTVEIDWSAASYWYEIVALLPNASVHLTDAKAVSYQGDAEVQNIFKSLGVETTFDERGATLTHTGEHTDYFEWNLINQPDLAQTVVVTCAMLGIKFKISGLQTLRIKETDRIAALITECAKFGIVMAETSPGILEWNGKRIAPPSQKISIATYEDHRMAMAFAPVALLHPNIIIEEPNVVTKSYPTFWADLEEVGFKVE